MPKHAARSASPAPAPRKGGGTPVRVLFLVHNHPSFHPGGAEIYALDLHRAMRKSDRFDSLLLAGASGANFPRHLGRAFFRVSKDDGSELIWSVQGFDDFFFTSGDKRSYTRDLRSVLQSFQPDVVHVQHTLQLGLEALTEIRQTCPDTPIVYTLHEFLPICYSRGIMLRRGTDERCSEASPWRCHQCFPERSPAEFVLRERFIKAQLDLVDLFLAPSLSLAARYVDWGIAPDRIRFHEYGRRLPESAPAGAVDARRFVFLGQTMRHKGILVLLQAMRLLMDRGCEGIVLYVDGANMEFDGDEHVAELKRELTKCRGQVVFRGRYNPEEVPTRLREAAWVVVPSIWWENSPLVIQEAFMHRRPVICSDIGGMAEKVKHGVNGLHFRAGDPAHLADVLEEAAGNEELWLRLQEGIPEIYSLEESVSDLAGIYDELIQKRLSAARG